MYYHRRIKILKRCLRVAVLLLSASPAGLWAQQDAQYTQYMYNTMVINPAYTGSRGVFSTTLLHRSQWVGLKGAPTTQTLNLHSPVSPKMGLGISIVNDEIGNGTMAETNFDISASYTVQVSNRAKLSFGLKMGGHILNVDFTKLAGYSNEPIELTNIDNKFSPNIGAGMYYQTNRFYLGISAPSLLETKHYDSSDAASSYVSTERINYYLIVGNIFDLSHNLKIKPTALLKAVKGAPLQVDLSTNFMFNEKLILGMAYRWDASISTMVGFHISDSFMMGITYDKEITALGDTAFNNGSFEVLLRYEFFNKTRRLITSKFF